MYVPRAGEPPDPNLCFERGRFGGSLIAVCQFPPEILARQ